MGLQFLWNNGVLLGLCIVIEINFQLLVHNIILLMSANLHKIILILHQLDKKVEATAQIIA